MGGGPAIVVNGTGYKHLIKDAKPWWKNGRASSPAITHLTAFNIHFIIYVGLVVLNLWIVLLFV